MSFVVWMNEGKLPRDRVGGKGAALSDLAAAGFNVPLGFCITADAYRHYATSTGLEPKVAAVLEGTDASQPDSVKAASQAICELIKATPLPGDLRDGLSQAYAALMAKQEMACAVRSSAISEDGNSASFAGLYETYLNVRGETDILDRVHRCYESLWTERAVGYRARNGHDSDEAMSVVVMGLVASESSGIAFTAHPVTGSHDVVIINASWGLGEAIVSGKVTPDSFLVSKGSFAILEREIYPKEIATYPEGNGTVERAVDRAMQTQPSLTDDEACSVARLATQVEAHYGAPQDVEWALAGGELYLLQSRPITTL